MTKNVYDKYPNNADNENNADALTRMTATLTILIMLTMRFTTAIKPTVTMNI